MSRRLTTYLESCQQLEPLEINLLVPSEDQIRSTLGELDELCSSIKHHGLLQPILVRPKGNHFEVVCGNRRLEACRHLMRRYVDCIVRELSDQAAFEISLVENIQRRTLSAIEEARAFRKYVSEFGWGGISDLATKIGKSEEYVSHRILLLDLPDKILAKLERNEINPSQAQELLWFKDESIRDQVLADIETQRLSVNAIRSMRRELDFTPSPPNSGQHRGLVLEVQGFRSADSKADFEYDRFGAISNHKNATSTRSKDHRAIEQAILALRVALIRLDSAISKCESKNVKEFLMSERLALHGQIDRLICGKKKMSS